MCGREGEGVGTAPYMAYTGTCRWKVYVNSVTMFSSCLTDSMFTMFCSSHMQCLPIFLQGVLDVLEKHQTGEKVGESLVVKQKVAHMVAMAVTQV